DRSPGWTVAPRRRAMATYSAHVRTYGRDAPFSWNRMGRAFVELIAVAVAAVALYVLWGNPDLGGFMKFGLPLAVVLVVDRLLKFEAFMALMTPVILIGGMASGLFTPTEAAVAAVAWALFLGFVWYRTLNWRMLVKISMETIETTATVLFIVAAASLFGWVLTTTQITEQIAGTVLGFTTS